VTISASPKRIESYAGRLGRGPNGLAGSVDAARTYQATWCTITGSRHGIFANFAPLGDDAFDGIRAALNHVEEAFAGLQDQLEATAQEFRAMETSASRTDQAMDNG